MSPERIAELRALADAASPGPWTALEGWLVTSRHGTSPTDIVAQSNRADGPFVAAAREAVPALLDEVERLNRENEELRSIVADEAHYVIFTEDRWTVEHPVACRLGGKMHECAYHAAIERIADEPPDEDTLGRWRITDIDSEGLPSLERAEAPGDV